MTSSETVFVQDVRKKVSASGNPYFLIDILEPTGVLDENGDELKKRWTGLYLNGGEGSDHIVDLKGQKAYITLTFYPYLRKVRDVEYMDIKANIQSIELAE
jgi:hypothetical protein